MTSFPKPPKSFAEQLQILKDRGLIVSDEPFALNCLAHHNYYRLSAYRQPFETPTTPDVFLSGITFDDIWQLYLFDQSLRALLGEAMRSIELSVRTQWSYLLAHRYGPQSYETPLPFSDLGRHDLNLAKLDESLRKSEEKSVSHYRSKHNMMRPPIWVVSEILSFGELEHWSRNLTPSNQKKLALIYDLPADVFVSFLKQSSYIRNMCAHHARVWNRHLTFTLKLPKTTPAHLLPNLNVITKAGLYNSFVLIDHVLRKIDSSSDWTIRLKQLIQPLAAHHIVSMGFPPNWRQLPMWVDSIPSVPSMPL